MGHNSEAIISGEMLIITIYKISNVIAKSHQGSQSKQL